MIDDEEKQYYIHAGMSYRGLGAVVEIGCWLGCSTWHILNGLNRSGNFANRQLVVIDDFIWRASWMDRHTPEELRVQNHAPFRATFEHLMQEQLPQLDVRTEKIITEDGNAGLPSLTWSGNEIELCFVDCGRTFEVNEGWYEKLAPYFIPGQTLIIMEDWGHHRDVPVRAYNQTKQFTDSKAGKLNLIDEVVDGTLAAFRFISH